MPVHHEFHIACHPKIKPSLLQWKEGLWSPELLYVLIASFNLSVLLSSCISCAKLESTQEIEFCCIYTTKVSSLTHIHSLRGTTALTGTSRRQYGSIAWFSVFEEQMANLLPQHFFESAWFNNHSHLVAKQENITGEKRVRKFGWQSISLMLCRILLHAVNLQHGTNSFTSPMKEVRARVWTRNRMSRGSSSKHANHQTIEGSYNQSILVTSTWTSSFCNYTN
jgi:hypothetical protein